MSTQVHTTGSAAAPPRPASLGQAWLRTAAAAALLWGGSLVGAILGGDTWALPRFALALALVVAGIVGVVLALVSGIRVVKAGRAAGVLPLVVDGWLVLQCVAAPLATFAWYFDWQM